MGARRPVAFVAIEVAVIAAALAARGPPIADAPAIATLAASKACAAAGSPTNRAAVARAACRE